MRIRICAALLAAFSTAVAHAADRPQFGTWGFDASGMDRKTKPGNDFFRHVNGAWLDRTRIPPDRPAFSLRILMTVRIEERLHDMMEKAAQNNETSNIEGKVGAFYKAFMDEARIETLGAKPIAPESPIIALKDVDGPVLIVAGHPHIARATQVGETLIVEAGSSAQTLTPSLSSDRAITRRWISDVPS